MMKSIYSRSNFAWNNVRVEVDVEAEGNSINEIAGTFGKVNTGFV